MPKKQFLKVLPISLPLTYFSPSTLSLSTLFLKFSLPKLGAHFQAPFPNKLLAESPPHCLHSSAAQLSNTPSTTAWESTGDHGNFDFPSQFPPLRIWLSLKTLPDPTPAGRRAGPRSIPTPRQPSPATTGRHEGRQHLLQKKSWKKYAFSWHLGFTTR